MKSINNRYIVDETLAKNQTGEILLCRDSAVEYEQVMLKLFTHEFSIERHVDAIADHVEQIRTVRHPNLISINEFDLVKQIDGKNASSIQYFYTYESYGNDQCLNYLELNRDEMKQVIAQILKCLRYLHFRGICYKFLNFDNLLIIRNDKGLSVRLKNLIFMNFYTETVNINSSVVSTFTAPEVIWENHALPSSDVYSFGVMLYYMYFNADYRIKQFADIHTEKTENEIHNLIRKMTSTYAGDRFTDIGHVIEEVDRVLRLKFDWDDTDAYNVIHPMVPLVAREREVKAIMDLAISKITHKTGVNGALIVGERGIGKTRLSQEIGFRLKLSGFNVIELTSEKDGDFVLSKELIKRIFQMEKVGFELIQKYGSELVKLLPEIAVKWKVNQSEVLPTDMEKLKIANRVFNFVSDFSETEPMVLIVDDLKRLNHFDLIVLDYLIRRETGTPLFIIACATEQCMNDGCVGHWCKESNARRVNLSGFTYEDAGSYVSALLGIAGRPLNFVTHLMKYSGGIPGRLSEMVRDLHQSHRLFVNSQYQWNMDDVVFDEVSPLGERQVLQFARTLENLDATLLSILEIMSIFEEAISCDTLSEFLDIDHKATHTMLNRLIEESIVEEKFGDWGYTYNFSDRHFKALMNDRIGEDKIVEYHRKAAEIFEIEIVSNKKKYSDALIFHLALSKQYEKAAQYCMMAADHMRMFNIDSQVLSYLEKADDFYGKMGSGLLRLKVLLQIGMLLSKNGRFDDSLECHRLGQKIATELDATSDLIDHMNRIAAIYLLNNRIDEAEDILSTNLEMSIRSDCQIGRIETTGHLIGIRFLRYRMDGILEIIQENLELARGLKRDELVASYHFLEGQYHHLVRNPYEAIECYEAALDIQSRLQNCGEIIYTQNAIGMLYAELLGLYDKANVYFKKSMRAIESMNFVEAKHLGHLNLAKTFLLQDLYDEAYFHLNKSLDICESVGNRAGLFISFLTMCQLELQRHEYGKAYAMMKKAELEYRKNRFWASQTIQYFYMCIDFYIETRNFDKAEQYLAELYKSNHGVSLLGKGDLEIRQYLVEHYKDNYLLYSKKLDFSFIAQRCADVSSILEAKQLRRTILTLAKAFVQYQKFIDVKRLLDYDKSLIHIFNSTVLAAKRSTVEGVLTNDRISHFNRLLNREEDHIYPEDSWFINKQLGDEHLYAGNLYLAANSYFTALDTVRMLTFKLNHSMRENYIIFDEGKIDLKKRINGLLIKVLEGKVDAEKLHFKGIEYNSLEEFFDLGPVRHLYQEKRFLESVFHHYENRYKNSYENVDALTLQLGNDDRHNILTILQYCIQKTVAERAYLFIQDENGKLAEVIKSDPNAKPPEIQGMLKNIENSEAGLVVSALFDLGNRHLLNHYQKGIIFIPVKRNESKLDDLSRRKGDFRFGKSSILAYVYLESSMVLNNFSHETVAELHAALNLLHVLLDNYNLKRISTNDRLTGVFLRKYIEEILPLEFSRARAENLKMSVIMCDIDKFKNINDIYGHRKGDEILSAIGKVLRNTLRKTDFVGRYGGEEFIILLPETAHSEAFLISEKLRRTIEEIDLLGENRPVTMSFGVSEFPAHGLNEEELIERADQALYFSKNTGRNRTTVWNESIGQAYYRFDRLAGILTGNISSDTRTVQAIIDTLDIFKQKVPRDDKLNHIMRTLIDITEAQDCAIYMREDGIIRPMWVLERGKQGFTDSVTLAEDLVDYYFERETGQYFINWEETSKVDLVTGIPIWKSCIVMPLADVRGIQGLLVLTVPISSKEFDFNMFNYVSAYSGILATIL